MLDILGLLCKYLRTCKLVSRLHSLASLTVFFSRRLGRTLQTPRLLVATIQVQHVNRSEPRCLRTNSNFAINLDAHVQYVPLCAVHPIHSNLEIIRSDGVRMYLKHFAPSTHIARTGSCSRVTSGFHSDTREFRRSGRLGLGCA